MELQRQHIHFSRETLLDYILGELPDWQAIQIEESLADCGTCAEQVRELNRLDSIWDEFDQPLLMPEPDRAAAIRALGLKVWAAVKLVYESPTRLPRLISEELQGLVDPETPFGPFVPAAPAPRAVPTLGAIMVRGSMMSGAVRLGEVSGPSGSALRLDTKPGTGLIVATLRGWPAEQPLPALLITGLESATQFAECHWEPAAEGEWRTEIDPGDRTPESAMDVILCSRES